MDTSPTDATPTPNATVVAHAVPAGGGRLHVADRPGRDPAFVLMHGFPDDSRIYDRLTPLLAPRRVVAFDFMGYGRSDRPDPPSLDPARHQEALAAVLDALGLDRVALVAHDASGPVAIDFAVGNPDRVEQLVLLDTYYGHGPSLRFPEMIRLLADPRLTPLADAMMDDPDQRLWLLGHTAKVRARPGRSRRPRRRRRAAPVLRRPGPGRRDRRRPGLDPRAVRRARAARSEDRRGAARRPRPARDPRGRLRRRVRRSRCRPRPRRPLPSRNRARHRRCVPLAPMGPARGGRRTPVGWARHGGPLERRYWRPAREFSPRR